MFVYSMRATTLKFFGVVVLSVITLIVLIAVIPTFSSPPITASSSFPAAVSANASVIDFSGIKTAADGTRFLSQYGWKVSGEAEEEKVKIPAEFDAVLDKYNEIQKNQGMDLSKYRNKTLVRYTYEVANFGDVSGIPYGDTVYITILIYRNKVVAGDVCTADLNGFITGLNGKM